MKAEMLTGKIMELPPAIRGAIDKVAAAARAEGLRVYLVGGIVRDMLLGLPTCDLDLAVEGDALKLARALQHEETATTLYPRFGTASLQGKGFRADLATTREERYARPGALPSIKEGTLPADLRRRDFTVNAMAVSLNPEDYGRLIDPCGGREDLAAGVIRVLHAGSFADDPTRIWRAARYEQRLGFDIEPATLALLKNDLPCLDSVTGERIWYELECVLREEQPEKALRRLAELGVTARLRPAFPGNGWLEEKFTAARRVYYPAKPPAALYLALFVYRLSDKESERASGYLHLDRTLSKLLRDTQGVKQAVQTLGQQGLKASEIYETLKGYAGEALTAGRIAADNTAAAGNIARFQDELRQVKPALRGTDLIALGVPPGPDIKKMLATILTARLDAHVNSRADEVRLVKSCLATEPGHGEA